MINPIKAIKLIWYMRYIPEGMNGHPQDIADAFIRAKIIKEEDRKDAEQQIRLKQIQRMLGV